VNVGPYALIEGCVRIGSGTDIQAQAVIAGRTRIGKNNRVGYGAIIGSFPQDLSFDPKTSSCVEIGDNNVIREYCTIHRGTKEGSSTFGGSNNLFMVGAHLGHNTRVADHVILANNVLLAGYAEIHDRVSVAGGSVVHQFTRMGAVSLLQGISGIGKDIPPFSIAIGRSCFRVTSVCLLVALMIAFLTPSSCVAINRTGTITLSFRESRHSWSTKTGLTSVYNLVVFHKEPVCRRIDPPCYTP
jgi:acyl-ACP--UDP-N-acetylglucosamine O-acyltransferase